jgi:hypothetical protein
MSKIKTATEKEFNLVVWLAQTTFTILSMLHRRFIAWMTLTGKSSWLRTLEERIFGGHPQC